jgi:two-component system chemotaxis sensor kinase CheA
MSDEKKNERFDDKIINKFLLETKELTEKIEFGFDKLNENPEDQELLSSILKQINILNEQAVFFNFKNLEGIAYFIEDIISKLRDGLYLVDPEIINVLFESIDHIKIILGNLLTTKTEGNEDHLEIILKLKILGEKYARKAVQCKTEEKKEVSEEPPPSVEIKNETIIQKEENLMVNQIEEPEIIVPKIEKVKKESVQEKVPDNSTNGEIPSNVQTVTESNIRVDTSLLDNLMNLAGELVLSRNRIVQLASKSDDIELINASQSMNLITTEIQEKIMKTRMQQIGNVFNKFPRVVRDLSKSGGKEVELVLQGAETELDKTILEAIKDPLTHIIRNSIDHGFELPSVRTSKGKPAHGTLTMHAYHQGGQVIIEISDNGAGIDIERVKRKAIENGLIAADRASGMSDRDAMSLLFKPGFSTAEKVTNISGRGVGMDVVKTNIEKLGGTVDIQSEAGEGTVIRIKIPLTLAIIPALIVHSSGERFAIPQINLVELVRLEENDIEKTIEKVGDAEFYRLRGEILPLIRLSEVLNLKPLNGTKTAGTNIVVLVGIGKQFGLIVDGIIDTEEIVVKPMSKHLKNIHLFAGATIMGDGKVALILDVVNLAASEKLQVDREELTQKGEENIDDSARELQSLLLFNVSDYEQFAVPLTLVSRLEKIKVSDIEVTGGKEVIRYRGASMPVIRLENYLSVAPPQMSEEAYIISFELENQNVGFYVSKILDAIETNVVLDKETFKKPGLLGSSIIQNKITLLLDVYTIIEMYDPSWFTRKRKSLSKQKKGHHFKVMIVEDSQFWRTMEQSYLESADYSVLIAENGEEGLSKLLSNHIDLCIVDLDMPVMDGFEMTKQIRAHEKLKNIPLIAITGLTDEADRQKAFDAGVDAYILKLNREEMLNSIEDILEKIKN